MRGHGGPARRPGASQPGEDPIGDEVRALVRRRTVPAAGEDGVLPDGLALGAAGLGLDSIALAELLIDCAARFGIPRPVELLDGPTLTVGRLIAHVRAAASA